MTWTKEVVRRISDFRSQAREKYAKLGLVILFCIPVIIVLMAEYNHIQSVTGMLRFLSGSFSVFLFDILVASSLFITTLMLFRHAWIAVLVNGVLFYGFSCVEFFKFQTSGSHFSFSDLALAGDAGDLTRFATLFITKEMVFNFLVLLLMVLITFLLNIRVRISVKYSLAWLGVCCISISAFLFYPKFSQTVFDAFQISRQPSANTFSENEKFENNYMIAYLTQSTIEKIENTVQKPKGYSKEMVSDHLGDVASLSDNRIHPNILFVMSESFSDFRKFDSLKIDPSIYQNFDRIGGEGFVGQTVVPTFGGATVRTEFELMFGLPVMSLNNALVPHDLLNTKKQQVTVASHLKTLGYQTAYIHPFSSTFYSRDSVYSTYGFDQMLFQGNMTVEEKKFRAYTDDSVVFDQMLELIKQNDQPSYLYATTMQNHQPYRAEGDPGGSEELDYYLEGIRHTDQALGKFIDQLKTLDEPTIVVFLGDHMPFFSTNCDLYEELGVANSTSRIIYQQKYMVWANYDFDYSKLYSEEISAFYIPHNILNATGLQQDAFYSSMEQHMKENSVYTYSLNRRPDSFLDLLTYDRVLGEQYSK